MLAANLEGAIAGVAQIGYKTVETPSYMGKTPAQLRDLFDRNGVKCTSAHIGMRPGTDAEPGLRGDLVKLAADMHTLGATHVYAPAMAIPDRHRPHAERRRRLRLHRARRRGDERRSLEAPRRGTDRHRPQAEGRAASRSAITTTTSSS